MADAGAARASLRQGFSTRLREIGLPLELIAEDVLGDGDEPIDWLAAGPDGRAWVILLERCTGSASLLERGLVQRAWVAARIPDWRQLAPALALRPGLSPGVLLVALDHPRSTRIAAREFGDGAIRLARWSGAAGESDLELIEPAPRPRELAGPSLRRLASIFRTHLSDADLAS